MKILKLLSLLLFLIPFQISAAPPGTAEIYSYPMPGIYHASSVFTLEVNGKKIPVVGYNSKYDYAHFSLSAGKAEALVTLVPGQAVTSYRISPEKKEIKGILSGNQLKFYLKEGDYLIVKINNLRELVIAADVVEKDQPTSSGKTIFNITRRPYSVKPNQEGPVTKEIQQAIDDASKVPGGKGIVYVPAGVYPIGNLQLKSNTSLYLEGGSVLLFSGKKEDFKVNAHKASQKRDLTWWIYTDSGTHDVKIYGRGILDGNGKYATEHLNIGSNILAVMHSENVILDGLLIRDSGSWAIIPIRSKNLVFKNFKLFNRFDMGENDGIDVMESDHVTVEHAIGIALDDPFSTKTWAQNTDLCRNWPGMAKPQTNITFDNLVSWTYCYAYKIGQGVMQDQSNITFKNCVVYDAAVAIGIHHKWGTAGVNNVIFDHIDVERLSYQNDDHRTWAVFFMQNGDHKGSGPVSGVQVRNVLIRDAGQSPGKLKGLDSAHQFRNIHFEHIRMPGILHSASSLKEMNITDVSFAENISISP